MPPRLARRLGSGGEVGLDWTRPGYDGEGAVRIPAWLLRNRLSAALSTARERALRVYGERLSADAPELRAFVELAERLEAEGRESRVRSSW